MKSFIVRVVDKDQGACRACIPPINSSDGLRLFSRLSNCDLLSGKNASLSSLHLLFGGGFSICKTAQRYCYVYPLRRNQDPAPLPQGYTIVS